MHSMLHRIVKTLSKAIEQGLLARFEHMCALWTAAYEHPPHS